MKGLARAYSAGESLSQDWKPGLAEHQCPVHTSQGSRGPAAGWGENKAGELQARRGAGALWKRAMSPSSRLNLVIFL